MAPFSNFLHGAHLLLRAPWKAVLLTTSLVWPSQERQNSILLWFRLLLEQFVRINIFLVGGSRYLQPLPTLEFTRKLENLMRLSGQEMGVGWLGCMINKVSSHWGNDLGGFSALFFFFLNSARKSIISDSEGKGWLKKRNISEIAVISLPMLSRVFEGV